MLRILLIFLAANLFTGCEYFSVTRAPTEPTDTTDPLLYESFEGSNLDLTKWGYGFNGNASAYPGNPLRTSIASGNLQIDYLAGDPAYECPSIHTLNKFDLRDHFVIFEITTSNSDMQAEAGIIFADDQVMGAYFTLGTINVYRRDGGVNIWALDVPFDPTAKYVRFRHQTSDDTYYIDFSSDKITWTPVHSVPAWVGLDPANLEFYLDGCHAAGIANETVQYSAVFTDAVQN